MVISIERQNLTPTWSGQWRKEKLNIAPFAPLRETNVARTDFKDKILSRKDSFDQILSERYFLP